MAKINIFEDKTYDNLEWLEKAVESYICPVNKLYDELPDSYSITVDDIIKCAFNSDSYSRSYINLEEILAIIIDKFKISDDNSDYIYSLKPFFMLEISPLVTLDLTEKSISKEIFVKKIKPHLEDDDIRQVTVQRVNRVLTQAPSDKKRMSEIADILGAENKKRSVSANYYNACSHYISIILEDKWRVRNTELLVNGARWINDYCHNGNLAALSNLTRLKCMVHKGVPIYSMEETR